MIQPAPVPAGTESDDGSAAASGSYDLQNPNGGTQEFTGNGISAAIVADNTTFITLRLA